MREGAPYTVALAGPFAGKNAQNHIDKWLAGTDWPKDTDPMSCVHFSEAGHGTFLLPDLSTCHDYINKAAKHKNGMAALGALIAVAEFSQFDASDVVRLFRRCYEVKAGHYMQHNEWVRALQRMTVVVQGRQQSRSGIANLAGVCAELVAAGEALRDFKIRFEEERLAMLKTKRRRALAMQPATAGLALKGAC